MGENANVYSIERLLETVGINDDLISFNEWCLIMHVLIYLDQINERGSE